MTLRELKIMIENYEKSDPACLDNTIVVMLSEDSFGPTANTDIEGIYAGFDWDHGKFLIQTKDKLVRE